MTEPVRPLEALIAKWRRDSRGGFTSAARHECADELAVLLQAAAPPAPTADVVLPTEEELDHYLAAVWNARGAADIQAAETCPPSDAETPTYFDVIEAIKALDR